MINSELALPYTLVVCEKRDAARRVAQAIATSNFKMITPGRKLGWPSFFSITGRNNQHFIVCYAMGHLYGLVDVKGKRSTYPVFDVKWIPIKGNARGRQIIETISTLSQKAAKFVHACDYDLEGEVIGYNVLQYACNNKYENSLRAKFSTMTDEEIRSSFDNLLKPSTGMAEAGKSRHMIDFIYGINFSRALTQSFKVSNNGKRYRNLSIGRVQGPTLAFVVDREMEIKRHIPEPYWTILAEFEKNGQVIQASYYKSKIRTLSEATSIVNACTNQYGKIMKVEKQKVIHKPPTPFNLGDLQKEAYRVFKFSPSYTLSIAQRLYIAALISYPRTSSQKLPMSLNYKKIISNVSQLGYPYVNLASSLLARDRLFPNEGFKIDPAHPAIYPTGEKPKGKLDNSDLKLLDLIIKRFLATFADPATSLHTTVTIHVKGEHVFTAEGNKMLYDGWIHIYKPYFKIVNIQLPELFENDILKNIAVSIDKKFTQPPPRFNQASLLEKMEKDEIGTKATRSEVISTLFKRNYISYTTSTTTANTNVGKKGIEATQVGIQIIQSMRKYVPTIVSTDLTRNMEGQLEEIELGKSKSTAVIESAVDHLKGVMLTFKEKEVEIGKQITDAVLSSQNQQQQISLGTCPQCNNGKLIMIRSATTRKRFVGCSNYSTGMCKATAPLPQKGSIKASGKICTQCSWPIAEAFYGRQTKRQWEFCVNIRCPSKKPT